MLRMFGVRAKGRVRDTQSNACISAPAGRLRANHAHHLIVVHQRQALTVHPELPELLPRATTKLWREGKS